MQKLLTIVVPAYNMEAYLDKCLSSLDIGGLSEGLRNVLQVIVVNDGSKDHTSGIAHKYANLWPSVFEVVDKVNGHYGSCINEGLRKAKGEYIKILEADDSYDTAGFHIWLSFIAKSNASGSLSKVDCLLTDCYIVNKNDCIVRRERLRIKSQTYLPIKCIPYHYAFQNYLLAWRTEMLRSMKYVQTEGILYTDTEWIIYPMDKVRGIYYFPVPVYKYLIGREGQSMDPAVFRRCTSHRVQVFARMMKMSKEDCLGGRARRLYRRRALEGVESLFRKAMAGSLKEINRDFQEIDGLIKMYSGEVYDDFSEAPLIGRWRSKYCITRGQKILFDVEGVWMSVVRWIKRGVIVFLCK